jgi:5-hydroxyisourate hydrolase
MAVSLEILAENDWMRLADAVTDQSGRAVNLIPLARPFELGTYRLLFDAAAYFRAQSVETFYSQVSVTFEVRNPGEHYHVPLLLSPWGYTTYRGS